VFHIMVSGLYSDWRETQNIIPVEHLEQPQPDQHPDNDQPVAQVVLGSGSK
jgi:hypothetical protein